jgi:hypothetical protein
LSSELFKDVIDLPSIPYQIRGRHASPTLICNEESRIIHQALDWSKLVFVEIREKCTIVPTWKSSNSDSIIHFLKTSKVMRDDRELSTVLGVNIKMIFIWLLLIIVLDHLFDHEDWDSVISDVEWIVEERTVIWFEDHLILCYYESAWNHL